MTAKPIRFVCVAALALALAAASLARAQEPGKTKDAALDSLARGAEERRRRRCAAIEEGRQEGRAGSGEIAVRHGSGPAQKSKDGAGLEPGQRQARLDARQGKPAPKAPKPEPRAQGSSTRRSARKAGGEQGRAGAGGASAKPGARRRRIVPRNRRLATRRAAKLGGKDKEIDARLEELAGRKRKRPHADDEQRSGPVGEMIKEMRDVEQRLGKPDPSEDTQAKQKQIIKRIDTLIEQVRQSGSSAGRLTIRRRQRQGNQPGQQEGDQPGALAQGARPMKPAKPTSQHSTAGGKGVWGHLPRRAAPGHG